jgi:putative MATE family efflux protein
MRFHPAIQTRPCDTHPGCRQRRRRPACVSLATTVTTAVSTRPLRRIARRDDHDHEIFALAIPAFGALAAEPLYVLVDTAIIGHLGKRPLAGLAVSGIVLTAVFGIFNFLAYGSTAAVARRIGAGDRKGAVEQGIDGLWLALALGILLTILGLALAPWIVGVMGASARVRPDALTYLRISVLGAPLVLLALAGAGYQRGCQDTKVTLVIALAANAGNLLVELFLVYVLHLGIAGSAWGTVLAQLGAAVAYVAIVGRAANAQHAHVAPDWAGIKAAAIVGSQLVVRTGSLLFALVVTTAIASRIGDTEVAAHQVAYQVWTFLALSLDAIAIAGQALVGRYLGADDARGTRAAARRMLELGALAGMALAVVIVAARVPLAQLFTDDPAVRHMAASVLVVVGVLQPLAASVFVLDGILIGAGDTGYLAVAMLAATAVYLPVAALVLATNHGLLALWGAIAVWMLARFAGMAWRYAGNNWIVTGATR